MLLSVICYFSSVISYQVYVDVKQVIFWSIAK
jgi:hypothetical protein